MNCEVIAKVWNERGNEMIKFILCTPGPRVDVGGRRAYIGVGINSPLDCLKLELKLTAANCEYKP